MGQKSKVSRVPQQVGSACRGLSSCPASCFTKMVTGLRKHKRVSPRFQDPTGSERIRKKTWPVCWCLSTKSEMSVNENTKQLVSVQVHLCVCLASRILKTPWRMQGQAGKPQGPKELRVARVPVVILTLTISPDHLCFPWSNMNAMFFWTRLRGKVEKKDSFI